MYRENHHLLCKLHFFSYFETKVLRTIKRYQLFTNEDKICVATSGGKDSLALLYLIRQYAKHHPLTYFALAVDEGIHDYRDKTLQDLQRFCTQYDIPLHIASFQKSFGSRLDQFQERAYKEQGKKPCTVCGILRRTLLNRAARALGATKIATGHNLDDESQSFLMNTLLGNMRHNAALGPVTGLTTNNKFVQRVKPLYFVSERETKLYCYLKEFQIEFSECPNIHLSFRASVRDKLNELEAQIPGVKHSIVNSFLEILPYLKAQYQHEKPFSYCQECGDACAGEICNACKLVKELGLELAS